MVGRIDWGIVFAWVLAWTVGAGVGLIWVLGVIALAWHVIGWVTQ